MWSDVVLGVLFVVSGFVKAVDPVGFSYKIEEYLGMFQLSSWREFSVSFSVLLCVAEMTLGMLLLLRLWRRVTAVTVTLFILGFTILTYLISIFPMGLLSRRIFFCLLWPGFIRGMFSGRLKTILIIGRSG